MLSDPAPHGPFDPRAHALSLDLFSPGDVRPVWEANRFADLLLLVQAHRLRPWAGHGARAEARLAGWLQANPPFRGPNWACGQEAALRVLHLSLAHALAGGSLVSSGQRRLVEAHARRIHATRAYAAAQDNNHAISEPAGLFVCALLLGTDPSPHAAALTAAVARLVAPDGGFAQVSTGYHRLLLDVLSVVEWLRQRWGVPPFPASLTTRAAAATRWLGRLLDRASGATPRLGHVDGSHFADLSLSGEADARGSVERAARLFLHASAGVPDDCGCAWLSLPAVPPLDLSEAAWQATGSRGWARNGTKALLRTGPLRFRPGQSDLLNLDLWHGSTNILRDGGTFSYNPVSALRSLAEGMEDSSAHNAVLFDDAETMPRVGRFLRARWPATGNLADGAWTLDARGNRHSRLVRVDAGSCVVTDEVSGPFREATLRWRLPSVPWRATPHGAESALASLSVSADGPLSVSLKSGWEAPRYGALQEAPTLLVHALHPARKITTTVQVS